MRAVIAIPPLRDFYFTSHRFACLGAETVRKILQRNNFECSFHCFPLQHTTSTTVALPSHFQYLKQFILPNETGKLSYFKHYQHFGPSIDHCAQTIADHRPDICFLSLFAFAYAQETLELCDAIKRKIPSCVIAVGGGGVCAYPAYFIRHRSVDFCLVGECETNLQAFLEQVRSNTPDYQRVAGCYRKVDSNVFFSQPIPSSPSQIEFAWARPFSTRSSVYLSFSLSRGCPRGCRFCSSRLSHGSSLRTLPLQRLQEEISTVTIDERDLHKTIYINFEDDNLLLDTGYLFNAIRVFRAQFPSCFFAMENGIDYRLLTEDSIDRLVAAGMRQFNLSLGSADAAILAVQNRSLDLQHFEKVLRRIAQYQLPVITYFICGFKEDTRQTIAATLAYLASLPTQIGLSPFYAVPGIAEFSDLHTFDTLPPSICTGAIAYPWFTNGVSTETIITAFRIARYINLLHSEIRSGFEQELLKIISDEKMLFTVQKQKGVLSINRLKHVDIELVRLFFEKYHHQRNVMSSST